MKKIIEFLTGYTTLFITGLSALGYMLAYLYELGQCDYYHISSEFISIDLQSILSFISLFIVSLTFITTLVYSIGVVNALFCKSLFQLYVIDITICSILIAFVLQQFEILPLRFYFYYLSLGSTVLFIFIQLFAFYNRKKSLKPKPPIQDQFIAKFKNRFSFQFSMLDNKNFRMALVVYTTGALLVIVKQAGFYQALNKIDYPLVINNKQTMILLKKYGDRLFCKTYNIHSKKLGNIIAINLAKTDTLQISAEEIKINK